MTAVITADDVVAAGRRLQGVAHRTPVFESSTLDELTGASAVVKAESFQRTGSFKFRGAYNKISLLSPAEREAGVAAYSSGNHAQAVALAARLHNIPAVILMPEDTPPAKLAATRSYGAEIVIYDRYGQDRQALTEALAAERGMVIIPPYDDPDIMAGQGTVALELSEQAGGLDVIVVPVGGGGLIAGCATIIKHLHPAARIIGVEPEAGDDTRRSLRAGQRVSIPIPRTIADGQQLDTPGALTFEVTRRLVDDVVLVTDAELVDAMRFLYERLKLVAEPSGACATAALLGGHIDHAPDARIGLVLSGGNAGVQRFAELVSDGSGAR